MLFRSAASSVPVSCLIIAFSAAQSAKSRLWETINKQLDFFNKQTERKKIPRYEGGIYSLGEAEKAQNPVTMVGSSKLKKEKEKIMRQLEI